MGMNWTLREAANECGVSYDTVKRRLPALREAGIVKDDAGTWRVEPAHLIAVGLTPGKPSPPPGASTKGTPSAPQGTAPVQPDPALVQRLAEAEQALAVERVRREAAEALAAERQRALERADLAMRMIEARPVPTPAELVAQDAQNRAQTTKPARWWQRRA